MRPEEIPPELKKILDEAAGKEHSATGAVMTALAQILTAHEESWTPVLRQLRATEQHSRQVGEVQWYLIQRYRFLLRDSESDTEIARLEKELAALNCPCCVFGNHTEACTCNGENCCHPENHDTQGD